MQVVQETKSYQMGGSCGGKNTNSSFDGEKVGNRWSCHTVTLKLRKQAQFPQREGKGTLLGSQD